jgi:Spy/CpxP family protein refolding chaperone
MLAQPPGPPPRRGGPEAFLPPEFWRDANFAKSLKLTAEQTQKLDKLQKAQGEDVARLERDAMTASRNLRAALDEGTPAADRILAAGNRFAALRDQLLRKQLALLASQRVILTQAQWSALQQQAEQHRPPPPR